MSDVTEGEYFSVKGSRSVELTGMYGDMHLFFMRCILFSKDNLTVVLKRQLDLSSPVASVKLEMSGSKRSTKEREKEKETIFRLAY